MSTVDDFTGLPKLPEGMFWRVRRYSPNWYRQSPFDTLEVSIIEAKEEDVRKTTWVLNIIPVWTRMRRVTTEKTIESQTIWSDTRVVPEDYAGVFATINGVNRPACESDELSPELILAAAEKAFDRYIRKLRSNDLIGDYPPKSLLADGR